jgi:hypothetical protein
MLSWLFLLVVLFILLITLSSQASHEQFLYQSSHSEEFRMIPTDEAAQIYVPERAGDESIVFRPVDYSTNTTAPQRVERRYSTPMDVRSSPPSAYVRSF